MIAKMRIGDNRLETIHVKQRSDLTHKHNVMHGRHGWLRLTPAYSVKVVDEIIQHWPTGSRILDPFSGTATTPLCAAMQGFNATAVDINPFLVWFGQAKVAEYTEKDIEITRDLASYILRLVSSSNEHLNMCAIPALHNIERWWNSDSLLFLRRLKTYIDMMAHEGTHSKVLLLIAFCRTMIRTSNASFDHQSMSFKEEEKSSFQQLSLNGLDIDCDFVNMFREDVAYVLNAATMNPVASAEIVQGDSRNVGEHLTGIYDLVVTSPPYPNRMSYIREVRPYMYWLGYFNEAYEAGELDWQAIGGTWGIATSRLLQWHRNKDSFLLSYLQDILVRIAKAEHKNSKLLARYVEKYFEDMWFHLKSMVSLLSSGGRAYYIVGNSTFYNVLLPVERIYRDMMLELGLADVSIKVLRKRNSKKELFEYEVCGTKR
ncbi:MAG TPA: DNA adenine methylase [Ktedonobacteraceae bacterium]|nr:DNA adenine methylase [Ktedonobacteraceae bacterium]